MARSVREEEMLSDFAILAVIFGTLSYLLYYVGVFVSSTDEYLADPTSLASLEQELQQICAYVSPSCDC